MPQQMAHMPWFLPPKFFCLVNLSISTLGISTVARGKKKKDVLGDGISDNEQMFDQTLSP